MTAKSDQDPDPHWVDSLDHYLLKTSVGTFVNTKIEELWIFSSENGGDDPSLSQQQISGPTEHTMDVTWKKTFCILKSNSNSELSVRHEA